MKRMRQALSNQKGASMMIAIVVLLIAAVLAGVVLSAASINMHRINRNYKDQQAYLTMESVVLLLDEMVQGCSVGITYDALGDPIVSCLAGDEMGEMLQSDVSALLSASDTVKTRNLVLEESLGETVLSGLEVNITYEMNAGYGIELIIEVAEDGAVLSGMRGDFPAVLETADGSTTLTWKKGMITRMK